MGPFTTGFESYDHPRRVTLVYVYDQHVLLILIISFLAIVLSRRDRRRGGSSEDLLGYDHMEIMKRGPVMSLERNP
jgi:hypothetical protein